MEEDSLVIFSDIIYVLNFSMYVCTQAYVRVFLIDMKYRLT